MKTYGLRDGDGRTFAFEVSTFLVGRRAVVRIVRTIPGTKLIKGLPRWQLSSDADFCEFELEGVRFVVSEPFGDSSRYWIGPQPPRWVAGVERVQEAFRRANPCIAGLVERAKGALGR